jgi:hypothetical protein
MAKKMTQKRGYVLARCIGCGAVGMIGPGEEQPMCGRCLMPMLATQAKNKRTTRRLP